MLSLNYFYAALLAALLLAWRMHSTRLFVAAVCVGAAALATSPLARALAATLLPTAFAALSFTHDRGFAPARLRNHTLIALGPLALTALFSIGRVPQAIALLQRNYIDPVYTDWFAIPQVAFFATLLSFGVAAGRFGYTRKAADAALAFCVIAVPAALAVTATTRVVWLLAAALALVIALVETAYALAFFDELTGLPSRRALKHRLNNLRAPYAVAVVDVDHFKRFNDQHGHEVGDQVLRMVAARLRAAQGGTAYRSGGEEFVLVFPGLNRQQAAENAEAVRAAVEDARFVLRKLPRPRDKDAPRKRGTTSKAGLKVTISVGVAAANGRNTDAASVLRAADKAVYCAKEEGRNRVSV